MGKRSHEAEDLELFMPGPIWGLPCLSPFGIKLATWMRIARLPHVLRFEEDPRKGPKKKTPWIVEGSEPMGDSNLIIAHLVATRGVDPDAGLSTRERAVSLMLRRTLEEHFHQVLEYALFVLDEGWAVAQAHFDILPWALRPVLKPMIRNQCRKDGYIRGIGRHTSEEIAALASADLHAASALLGDQPFFFGDRPTTADATAFGFLSHTLWAPIPYFAQKELAGIANLVAYCERMRDLTWPEPAVEGPWWPDDHAAPDAEANAPKKHRGPGASAKRDRAATAV